MLFRSGAVAVGAVVTGCLLVIGIGLDTTERRRAQTEVYQSAKLATLGQMATGLAHEINQPLNVIQLTSENLRIRLEKLLPGNEDVLGRIEKIKRQVARMAGLVDHMRIFGRKSSLQMHLVDPTSAIEDALAIFGAELRLAGIDVHKSFPNMPAFVVAENNLLGQILLNLLVNARDFHGTAKPWDFNPTIEAEGDSLRVVHHDGLSVHVRARGGQFRSAHDWYENFDLPVERERGVRIGAAQRKKARTTVIGTAMPDQVGHRVQYARVGWRAVQVHESCNAAHG